MRQRYRLSHGGRIDRDRSLRFTFDGRTYEGFQGDTLASALLANGVRIVGRSFRLHRPRGLLAAGLEEPNAIVTVGRNATAETNLKATEVELCDGLVARSVNTWPSARCDLGALLSMFGSLLGPGFYYKTFMWPGWAVYEPLVRRLAGLGRATSAEDPDSYDTHHATCDVLVVGGGPAGLSAALAAGARGERVVLVDADREFGGQLLGADAAATIEGMPARAWLARTLGRLRECPNVRLLARTLATGYYDHNLVTLVEQSGMRAEEARDRGVPWLRLWKLRCSRVILAAGAIERPLVFPDNDRPGVMLASALACYLNRYAVLPGHAAVVVTNNDNAYDVAEALVAHGAHPVTIVDTRADVRAEVRSRLASAGVRVLSGYCVLAVHGAAPRAQHDRGTLRWRGRRRSVARGEVSRRSDRHVRWLESHGAPVLAVGRTSRLRPGPRSVSPGRRPTGGHGHRCSSCPIRSRSVSRRRRGRRGRVGTALGRRRSDDTGRGAGRPDDMACEIGATTRRPVGRLPERRDRR